MTSREQQRQALARRIAEAWTAIEDNMDGAGNMLDGAKLLAAVRIMEREYTTMG